MKSIHITNAEIFYNNQQFKKFDNLKISNILITSKDYADPIYFNIATNYKNTPITGNFKTDSLKDIIDDPNKIHITGMIDINDLKSNFSGIINYKKNLPSISMTLSRSAPNLQSSLKNFVELPNVAPITGDIELIATPTF